MYFFLMLLGIFILALAIKIHKANKSITISNEVVNEEITSEYAPIYYHIYVTGLNHENRRDLLTDLIESQRNDLNNSYNNFSDEKVKNYLNNHNRLYEFNDIVLDINLIPDPNNNFDKNAIVVSITDINQPIGYIPKSDNIYVKTLLDNKDLNYYGLVRGGKYLNYNYDKSKILEEKIPYGLEVIFTEIKL